MKNRWILPATTVLVAALLTQTKMILGEVPHVTSNRDSYTTTVLGGDRNVDLMRRFRDEILARDGSGKNLIKRFYELLPDAVLVMIRDAGIRNDTMAAAADILPLISASLESDMIDPAIEEIMETLLDEYARSEAASPQLSSSLTEINKQNELGRFVEAFNSASFPPPMDNQVKRNTPHALPYSAEHVLVKFRPGFSQQEISGMLSAKQIRIVNHFEEIDVYKVVIDSDVSVEQAFKWLEQRPEIDYVEFDHRIKINGVPNDLTPELWGLNNIGQEGGTRDADIDAPEAWNLVSGSEQIIAVIDTGVDYTHNDLLGNIWANMGEIPDNDIDDDGNGYVDDVNGYDFANGDSDPMDDDNHGTHVSGTVAARGNNDIGVVGVNWRARIMALKIMDQCGSGELSEAVEAVLYAKKMGAKISNNSWGWSGEFSQTLYDAIQAFGESGGLFVAAAGNDGTDNDNSPHFPSSYDLPNIISVAATDRNDAIASFSNYGANSVDVAAPGAAIYSTIIGNAYDSYDGTSMATPHVAGIAALVRAQQPTWGFAKIKHAILEGVDSKSTLKNLVATSGRVNAYSALAAANAPTSPFDAIGVWRPSTGRFYLDLDGSLTWTNGIDAITASFGVATDRPVTGDWNGDGYDEIGVWRPNTGRFYLDIDGSFTWTLGVDLITASFGIQTDRPIAGDWNGDGFDEIGVWRPSTGRFYLDVDGSSTWTPGVDQITDSFGIPSDHPVAGDWNKDGIDDIGVWRPSTGRFYLDTDGSRTWRSGIDTITDPFGIPTDRPVAGDWNRDGYDEIGVWRPSTGRFYLDMDGSFTWTTGVDAITASFGVSTDLPVVGHW